MESEYGKKRRWPWRCIFYVIADEQRPFFLSTCESILANWLQYSPFPHSHLRLPTRSKISQSLTYLARIPFIALNFVHDAVFAFPSIRSFIHPSFIYLGALLPCFLTYPSPFLSIHPQFYDSTNHRLLSPLFLFYITTHSALLLRSSSSSNRQLTLFFPQYSGSYIHRV